MPGGHVQLSIHPTVGEADLSSATFDSVARRATEVGIS